MDARSIWHRLEPVHAVTYFAPESIEAARAAGLRGFWMGYFGFRACPMGPVEPAVVEASFANFAPAMVRRALPDAWSYAAAAALIDVRAAAAATALRRLVPDVDDRAAPIAALLARVVDAGDPLGRPLFAANRSLGRRADPVEELWQCCTSLREHRGDGHVGALAAAGVDGCEAHALFVADRSVAPEVHFDHRGWSDDERREAIDRLVDRGLLRRDGSVLTEDGREVRDSVEAVTDRLAVVPYELALSPSEQDELVRVLHPVAQAVAASGVVPFPNPMGAPSPPDD